MKTAMLIALSIMLSGCSTIHQLRVNAFSSWVEVNEPCAAVFYTASDSHEYVTCRDGRAFIR